MMLPADVEHSLRRIIPGVYRAYEQWDVERIKRLAHLAQVA